MNNVQMGLMALMACLGLGLMINSMVNPSKENKDAAMKMANAPVAPGARK